MARAGGCCDNEDNSAAGKRRGSGVWQGQWQRRVIEGWQMATVAGRHGRKAALEEKGRWWPAAGVRDGGGLGCDRGECGIGKKRQQGPTRAATAGEQRGPSRAAGSRRFI
ncbi:hypothetical protein BHM03_00034194 [Ensete ventricosum]|uniref:Uncharacterized protein n=1 Tax=Ensete ventricosum TaxID=4639 RepID=A0A445MIY4_ENSVE|nr:hypothetical protein BHM03_00034194 [Ensete ventricosum]